MAIEKLITYYAEGRITDAEFVSKLIAIVDDKNVRLLAEVPPHVLAELRELVDHWGPNMIFIGGAQPPTTQQLDIVRKWFASRL